MTGLTQEQVERAKRHITLLETYGSPWGNGLTRMSLAVVGESAGILRTLLSALPQPQESEREAARRDIEVKLNPGWLRRELRAASILMEEYREAERRAEQRIAKEPNYADPNKGGHGHG